MEDKLDLRLDGLYIIVLEDHDLVRRSMTQVLINLGFKVSSFASGIEFIQWLGRVDSQLVHEIALVVTDVVMPNMSGPEVWTEVQTVVWSLLVVAQEGLVLSRMAPGQGGMCPPRQQALHRSLPAWVPPPHHHCQEPPSHT